MIESFFPRGMAHYLIGGMLIGGGVGLLFVLRGLIGGTSTFFTSTLSYVVESPFFQQARFVGTRAWRAVYALGLVLGAALYLAVYGEPFQTGVAAWRLLLGGVLIGFGARLSNGCTAGHGICGLASLQWPSLLAVLTFLATAIGMAHLVQWAGGMP
ncbi:hypothetical protein EWI61_00050 [Methylolobus aquaticus]|nr:hypothetical protein EWI61_00050 [Methylolobus aquaticus]